MTFLSLLSLLLMGLLFTVSVESHRFDVSHLLKQTQDAMSAMGQLMSDKLLQHEQEQDLQNNSPRAAQGFRLQATACPVAVSTCISSCAACSPQNSSTCFTCFSCNNNPACAQEISCNLCVAGVGSECSKCKKDLCQPVCPYACAACSVGQTLPGEPFPCAVCNNAPCTDNLCRLQLLCVACSSNNTIAGCNLCPCPTTVPWKCPVQPVLDDVNQSNSVKIPRDFGEDYGYGVSWHYMTGQLIPTGNKKPLGFQWIFFRSNLLPGYSQSPLVLYAEHFSITDPNQDNGTAAYFFSLKAPVAASTTPGPVTSGFTVNVLDPVRPSSFGSVQGIPGAVGTVYELRARGATQGLGAAGFGGGGADAGVEMELRLRFRDFQGPTLHGQDGYLRSGYLPCSASNYFSLTNLQGNATTDDSTEGEDNDDGNDNNEIDETSDFVLVGSTTYKIRKMNIWYDRQWLSPPMENYELGYCHGNGIDYVDPVKFQSGVQRVANLTGWVWASLHIPELDQQLLFSSMLDKTQNFVPAFDYADVTGPSTTGRLHLLPGDFSIELFDFVNSTVPPIYSYPTRSKFTVPSLNLTLVCENVNSKDGSELIQEFVTRGSARRKYWEGLTACTGDVGHKKIKKAFGYFERVHSYA